MVFATLLACLVAQLASPETTVTPPWDETRDVQVGLNPRAPVPFPISFPTIDQVAANQGGSLPILPSMSAEPTITLAPNPSIDGATHYVPQDVSNPNWDGVRAYDNANHLNWSIAPVVIPSELGAEVANPFRLTGVGQFENAPMDSPSLGADQVGSVMVENWSEGTLAVAEQADLTRSSSPQLSRGGFGNVI